MYSTCARLEGSRGHVIRREVDEPLLHRSGDGNNGRGNKVVKGEASHRKDGDWAGCDKQWRVHAAGMCRERVRKGEWDGGSSEGWKGRTSGVKAQRLMAGQHRGQRAAVRGRM